MHFNNLDRWEHEHVFGQHRVRAGERRTLVVIALTGAMMVIEVAAGVAFGSMALLADGLHMASHAVALGINAFAYVYARRHAHDTWFNFGTGKVNALGGFTGAILLAVFAAAMTWESLVRLLQPVEITYDLAILVAVLGLIVNGLCVYILSGGAGNADGQNPHGHDHNLRSAYLHVLADALTSVLAIAALLSAKYLGVNWMDPVMGVIGAALVARWSLGLARSSGFILLDRQGPANARRRIREAIEVDGDSRIADMHLWSIGPDLFSLVITIVAHNPKTPEEYKSLLPGNMGLEHVSVEIHRSPKGP